MRNADGRSPLRHTMQSTIVLRRWRMRLRTTDIFALQMRRTWSRCYGRIRKQPPHEAGKEIFAVRSVDPEGPSPISAFG